ncbi:MAG TPA: DUF935 family protein, partial [Chroococcales cyanobacterium]
FDLKAVYRIRKDIKDWNFALNQARYLQPKNWMLQMLYDDAMIDALLSSQYENRLNRIFSLDFNIKVNGEIDEEQTAILRKHPLYRFLTTQKFKKRTHGYSLVELSMDKDSLGNMVLSGEEIPRTNVVPQTGLFYTDYFNDTDYVMYRDMPEFGTWILEYYDGDAIGMLNKVIPHVLFKRFAQSCWSELCEIFGIPPRVMKTNTQDKTQLNRAEQMMKDLGSAAYFIIDNDENFEWAEGVSTNGDVYKNLIDLCRDEICLLMSGAIIGQDTKNGSRSKDESAQEMLRLLVQADMAMIEEDWNNISIPALIAHGVLKGDKVTFEFVPTEDVKALWAITIQALQYYEIDQEWVKDKFGIEITGQRAQPVKNQGTGTNDQNLSAALFGGGGFFGKAPRRKRA